MKSVLCLLLVVVVAAFAATNNGVTNPSQAALDANDNYVIQLALTLEALDSTFFTQMLNTYNSDAFDNAGYAPGVWDLLNLLAQQEVAHRNLLNATLIQRTGNGLPFCTYDFSAVTSIDQFIAVGRLFENVGTGAYDGSINAIYNKTLQQAAATIATVEARHAAFLNQLPGNLTLGIQSPEPNKDVPFPAATDFAFNGTTVYDYIKPFITSCPYTINFPKVLAVVPVPAPNASFLANPTEEQVTANDVSTLNYALTLEILEATFYNRYLGQPGYTATDFFNVFQDDSVFAYLQIVKEHENAHVGALTATVQKLGFTPVLNCSYTFPVSNVSTFISVAQTLENTGVSAYDGAVNTINSVTYRQLAATVATVEARHAAYINQLNGAQPFPSNTDATLTPSQVIAAVTANFIVPNSCPIAPPVPNVLPIIPYSNSTASQSTSTGGSTSGQTSGSTSTSASGKATSTSSGKTSSTSTSSASVISIFGLMSVVAILSCLL